MPIHVSHDMSAELEHGGHKFASVDTKTISQTGHSEQLFFKFIKHIVRDLIIKRIGKESVLEGLEHYILTLSFFKNWNFLLSRGHLLSPLRWHLLLQRPFQVGVGRIWMNCGWAWSVAYFKNSISARETLLTKNLVKM